MKLLAYTSPARGHLYPLTPIAAELARRGHDVVVYGLASEVDHISGLGFTPQAIDPRIEALDMRDWEESSPLKAVVRAFGVWADRAPYEIEELQRHIADERPDALLVDTNSWGAMTVAEASGLPWSAFIPWVLPVPSRDAPPMGPGLAPLGGPIGRVRDAVVRGISNRTIDGALLERVNAMRAQLGLAPVDHTLGFYAKPPLLLSLTAEGFDYPRSDWPPNVRLVGPSSWAPPAETPDWLSELADPLVLVTCSTEFQDDRRLLEVALAGLPPGGFSVVGTSAAHDPASFDVPAGSRVTRFVPHDAVLERAACVVCHGGLGITQKALAAKVPVVVVPFGRDQLETARRVEVAAAGVRLPVKRLSPERLLAAVRTAVGRRPGAVRVSEAYAAAGGPAAAADAIEGLVAHTVAA